MPCVSDRQQLLNELYSAAVHVVDMGQRNASLWVESDVNDDLDEDVDEDSPFDPIIIPPPTPISPIVFLDILNSESEFDQDSDGGMCGQDEPYW